MGSRLSPNREPEGFARHPAKLYSRVQIGVNRNTSLSPTQQNRATRETATLKDSQPNELHGLINVAL